MSLNRFEQMMFDYWEANPDERRHWSMKTSEMIRRFPAAGAASRALERELWDYLQERTLNVSAFRRVAGANPPRVSLQNLAEHLIRIWGPLPAKKSGKGSNSP